MGVRKYPGIDCKLAFLHVMFNNIFESYLSWETVVQNSKIVANPAQRSWFCITIASMLVVLASMRRWCGGYKESF